MQLCLHVQKDQGLHEGRHYEVHGEDDPDLMGMVASMVGMLITVNPSSFLTRSDMQKVLHNLLYF